MSTDETASPWIVWVYYGMENWCPYGFDTSDEAIGFITDGAHGRCLLTRRAELLAADPLRES